VTGFYCSGCGTTRSAYALLNLDLLGAWRKNPAFVITSPFIVFGFLLPWLRWVSPTQAIHFDRLATRLPKNLPLWVLGALILFGILRNLQMEPFSLLAPR